MECKDCSGWLQKGSRHLLGFLVIELPDIYLPGVPLSSFD